jgi:hypothetical protein
MTWKLHAREHCSNARTAEIALWYVTFETGTSVMKLFNPRSLQKYGSEKQKSGSLAGFEVIWGGFHDVDIYADNREARDKVVNVIRSVNPDFIITHDPNDYMPDHVATSRLVFDASHLSQSDKMMLYATERLLLELISCSFAKVSR